MKKVIQMGDPRLEKQSAELKKIKSSKTQNLINDLLEICKSDPEENAGLSAPQIGINKQICIVRRFDIENEQKQKENPIKPKWEVLINPKITKRSKNLSEYWEGCLSVGTGNDRLFGPVTRPQEVYVEYLNEEGKKKSLNAKSFFSHVVQHEMDHLNGILFVKYVKNPDNLWRNKELNSYLKKHDNLPPVID